MNLSSTATSNFERTYAARDDDEKLMEHTRGSQLPSTVIGKEGGIFEKIESGSLSESTNPFEVVQQIYEANIDFIGSRSRDFNANDSKSVEDSINGFAEVAQATVKGLQALGQLHPFISVAVGAFVLVITMDLARRDNERKVIAIKLQMKDLMVVFFELRHIRNSQERGKDGISICNRMKGLMADIAKDIKACGSACDAYLKKSFLAKTIKASTEDIQKTTHTQLDEKQHTTPKYNTLT